MRGLAAIPVLAATAAFLTWAGPAEAQQRRLGIAGREAPSWGVTEWINLPEGKESLDVTDYRGDVLYLYGFQSWCPGCHKHGFPTLQKLIEKYEGVEGVEFVAVQTTFEGFGTNTSEAAWRVAERYGLDIPVGHSGSNGARSLLMQRYRTGGTPWTILIDKNGVVRFNDFHVSVEGASAMIETLRREGGGADGADGIETLPEHRGGQDLIGTRMPELRFDGWVSAGAPGEETACGSGTDADGARVTLYRWWTDTCPYCARSLPAIESLRKRYEDRGLRIVAVYHPKLPGEVTEDEIRGAARRFGYEGCVAIDRDWSDLKGFYLSTGDRRATSAAFITDAEGVIRFVHPGPAFFPSDDPDEATENRDYELIERAIVTLLARAQEEAPGSRAGGE